MQLERPMVHDASCLAGHDLVETLRGRMPLRPRHQVLRREQVGRLGLAEIPRISAEAVCEGPKGRTKYVFDRCQRQLRSCRTVCR